MNRKSNIYGEEIYWPSQHFIDQDLEADYRDRYFDATRGQFQQALIFGAALFTMFAPLDVIVVGNWEINNAVLSIWAARLVVVVFVITVFFMSDRIKVRLLPTVITIGWSICFLALWVAFVLATTERATEYLYSFTLISIGASVFLPFLFSRATMVQAFILLPIIQEFSLEGSFTSDDLKRWLYPTLVLCSTIFMGLYSRYFSERTLRENFVQSIRLDKTKKEAERANDAKSQFLATVSHELRTPLNGVLGNIRLINLSENEPNLIHQRLEEIERSSIAMRNLIDDVLNIARIEVLPNKSNFQIFELNEVVRDISAVLKPLARTKNIDLILPKLKEGCFLIGDSGRLRHILLNILGNAVKFTNMGFVELKFSLLEDSIMIEISDSGIGIPLDQIDKIFDSFEQASNAIGSDLGGTGLGLSIVNRLVDSLNGQISVQSKIGEGTVFKVTIPFVQTDTPPSNLNSFSRVSSVGTCLNFLVVEDDRTNMEILTSFLKYDGHKVISAYNGEDARKIFEPQKIDCILTDIHLPDMTGIKLLGILQNIAANNQPPCKVPAIAVTANVMPEDIAKYLSSGFAGVVSKPLDEQELFGAIKTVTVGGVHHLNLEHVDGAEKVARLQEILGIEEFTRIRALFKITVKDCSTGIQDAIGDNDSEKIMAFSHQLAGSAASIGEIEIAQAAKAIEDRLINKRDLRKAELFKLQMLCSTYLDESD